MRQILLLLIFHMLEAATIPPPKCDDIDTSACVLMHAKEPNLCHINGAAQTLCKRFCNLCPMECYHCDATVQDYHLCNTTKLCAAGEVCMRKELKSFFDGHHEYQLTCADSQICDGGNDLVIPFGRKREITRVISRDLSVTCCVDDMCNYPEPKTTTTATTIATTTPRVCPKDIIFILDRAVSPFATVPLLKDVILPIDIGRTANLVSVYEVDQRHGKKLMDLDDYDNKTELLSYLENKLHDSAHQIHTTDSLQNTINEIVNNVHNGRIGDRLYYDDVIVLILDEQQILTFQPRNDIKDSSLQQISSDVITLVVGPGSSASITNAGYIATDARHILSINSISSYNTILDTLLQLIQEC